MNRSLSSIPVTLLALALLLLLQPRAHSQYASQGKELWNEIIAELRTDEPRRIDSALAVLASMTERERIDCLKAGAAAELARLERHDELLRLCYDAINSKPGYINDLGFLLQTRVDALVAKGSLDVALQEAKRAFDVVPMRETHNVLEVIDRLLRRQGRDAEADAMRLQQIDSYTRESPLSEPSILSKIVVDPSLYPERGMDVSGGTANRLLMRGRAAEALAMFQTLEAQARTPKERALAVSGVARSLKAVDGCIGRANAYLRRQTQLVLAE